MSKRRNDDRESYKDEREREEQERQGEAMIMFDYLSNVLRFFGVKKAVTPFQSYGYGRCIGEPVFHPALPTELPVEQLDRLGAWRRDLERFALDRRGVLARRAGD